MSGTKVQDQPPASDNQAVSDDKDKKIAELQGQVERLEASLRAQKGAATKARNRAQTLEAEMPEAPRSFAPMDSPNADALRDALRDATDIELAFVGEADRELGEIPPRAINTAVHWQLHAGKLKPLLDDLQLHGPGTGKPPYRLAGYALLLDGEVMAVSARQDVLVIGAGQTVQLKDDIAF